MKRLLCILAFAGLVVPGANAGAVFVGFTPGINTGNQAWEGALGMDFDVLSSIHVTRLGVFDSNSDGIQGTTLFVTLYDRNTQSQITPVLSFTGNEGTLLNGNRFKSLAEPA